MASTDLTDLPEIDFLILADRAEAINGKLYMMGGAWDRMTIADFNQQNPFSIAIGVLVPWLYANESLPLVVSIEHEDGVKIPPELHALVNVGRPPNSVKGQSFRAIIAAQGHWKLPGPGTYIVKASLNAHARKQVQFHVNQLQSLPIPSPTQ
jgi:hypothetical protein